MSIEMALAELRGSNDLAIIRLTESFFAARTLTDDKNGNRISNASSTLSESDRDPAVLKADLQHYRDLFSKLRFSYVEQVTKEKFLKTITGDTPKLVTGEENATLDGQNKEQKALLSEKKEELRGMLQDLEAQGRELARRYHEIELQTTQLEMLPIELEELDTKLVSLNIKKEPQSEDPNMCLPLRETLALLAEREKESALLDAQIESLRTISSDRSQEIQRLEQEVDPLQMRREHAIKSMQDLDTRRHTDNSAEYQGRWLLNSEKALRMMLDV